MNAVVALCHFCELHGPSVLFCTQAFHEHFPVIGHGLGNVDALLRRGSVSSPKGKRAYYGPTELSLTLSQTPKESSTEKTCEGCRSMPIVKRYLCNDHEAKISYISSQYPMHPELFSLVRQACVRSLSCEVCPGREGPIYFGDNERGHVLSYTFFMKDSRARGFQRWYSIIIVMMDKIFLLNSWPFLLKHIQKLVSELQSKASKVYEVEQSECSQRMMRLNSVTRMTPDNFRRQRGNSKARSLTELTGDTNVFPFIHLWFTWILRAGGSRLSERLLEGLPSEDTVVDLEMQEETEEGFIKIHTKKVPDEAKGSSSTGLVESGQHPNASAASTLLSDLLEQNSALKRITVRSLKELYEVIGKEMFLVLCYHTIIGNQIILRGSNKLLIESIIDCLQMVLPRGCFHPVYYSNEYEDSWKCNFLGLPRETNIPSHVLSSELHICVDVQDSSETREKLSKWKLTLHHCTTLPEKLPQVLCDIERLVSDESSPSEKALESCVATLKEVWMNKVKVLFAFSRAGHHPVEETQKLLHVLGAQEQDKLFLKFWMTGLSTQYKMHVLSTSVQHNGGSIHESM